MAKFQIIVLIVTLALLHANAEPRRHRGRIFTSILSRQEEAPVDAAAAAVTPYPSADELKPDVPFEEAPAPAPLPEAAAPAPEVAPQPDEVYGPPEQTLYTNQPDEVYGPPEVTANDVPVEPAAEQFPPVLDAQQQRLVAARKAAALRQRQAAYRLAAAGRRVAQPAKLRAPTVKRRV